MRSLVRASSEIRIQHISLSKMCQFHWQNDSHYAYHLFLKWPRCGQVLAIIDVWVLFGFPFLRETPSLFAFQSLLVIISPAFCICVFAVVNSVWNELHIQDRTRIFYFVIFILYDTTTRSVPKSWCPHLHNSCVWVSITCKNLFCSVITWNDIKCFYYCGPSVLLFNYNQ